MRRIELALCIAGALVIALVVISEAKSLPKDDEAGDSRKSLKKGAGKFNPADDEDASDYLDGEEELIKTTKKPASRAGELPKSSSRPSEKGATSKALKKTTTSKASKKPTTLKPEAEELEVEVDEDEDKEADDEDSEDSTSDEPESGHQSRWDPLPRRRSKKRPMPPNMAPPSMAPQSMAPPKRKYVPRPPRVVG